MSRYIQADLSQCKYTIIGVTDRLIDQGQTPPPSQSLSKERKNHFTRGFFLSSLQMSISTLISVARTWSGRDRMGYASSDLCPFRGSLPSPPHSVPGLNWYRCWPQFHFLYQSQFVKFLKIINTHIWSWFV